MKRVVLFDFGETLVRYYRLPEFPAILTDCIEQAAAAVRRLGVPVPSDAVIAARTQVENFEAADSRVRPLESRLAAIFGISPGTLSAAQQATVCRAFLEPIFALAMRYPDSLPTLESLRSRGFRIGVISNTPWGSPAEPWREEVARHGIASLCDRVAFCRDVGWRKPAPAVFQHMLEMLDCAPNDCLFVGDSLKNDITGARRMGIDAVLIDRDGHARGSDHPAIVTLAELEALLHANA